MRVFQRLVTGAEATIRLTAVHRQPNLADGHCAVAKTRPVSPVNIEKSEKDRISIAAIMQSYDRNLGLAFLFFEPMWLNQLAGSQISLTAKLLSTGKIPF
jgi:hypothetical protein